MTAVLNASANEIDMLRPIDWVMDILSYLPKYFTTDDCAVMYTAVTGRPLHDTAMLLSQIAKYGYVKNIAQNGVRFSRVWVNMAGDGCNWHEGLEEDEDN